MRPRRSTVTIVLAVYTALLLVALLAPTSDEQSGMVTWVGGVMADLGLPRWLSNYKRLEVVMNALIIAPVSFLGSMLRPSISWRDWTAYGFAASMAVEAIQLTLLPGRQASFSDVVANTLGALLGAVAFQVGRAVMGAVLSVPARPRTGT